MVETDLLYFFVFCCILFVVSFVYLLFVCCFSRYGSFILPWWSSCFPAMGVLYSVYGVFSICCIGFEEKLSIAIENMSNSSSDFDDLTRAKWEQWFGDRIYLLFEFAYGYALVFAPDIISEVDVGNFESAEKYITPTINHPQPLKLKALHLFSSSDHALVEMNAISESTVTEQLKSFLLENISRAIDGNSNDRIATSSSWLAHNITRATKIPVGSDIRFYNVMRALRKDIDKLIDKFIELHPGDLENAQVNLACLYSKQRCTATYVENSMVVPYSLKVVVVPHKFEGIFVAKRKKKDIICTKNLVCGEALHTDDLISVENENGTEVEYRVWDPRNSKLAAAITRGVTDMWIKPGSRVLYLGDVCGITVVFQLSDLVGSVGLVYVVGMCDDIVNMANKRSNVVRIFGNPHLFSTYRMVVGMVDVLLRMSVNDVVLNAGFYLKTGGHYMIATQESKTNINVHDLFAHRHERREFKQIELIRLEPTEGAYVMVVGVFHLLEE
ncbi:hypothetical protein OROHE_017992 [Orobanche hederae]